MAEPPETQMTEPQEDPRDTLLLDELRLVMSRHAARASAFPQQVEHLEGTTIGGYLVGDRLGQGGMAQVYRARNVETGEEAALKVLRPQYREDASLCARLEREARSMGRIEHENVVRILGFPRGENLGAIAMELLEGGSLRDRLSGITAGAPRLEVSEAVQLAVQAARGLGAAHACGIVHRDIKPSNLLLDGAGRVKVADFGAILVLEHTTWLTGVGQQIGTPGYMSPEQCKGERVTPASDIYSLGATLYELLTGRLPFVVEEASPFALMLKHLSDPVPDPRVLREDIPEWLAIIMLKCLGKSPAQRYQTGAELCAALEAGAPPAPAHSIDDGAHEPVDMPAIRQQLQQLPQRAIVYWACRCARRVQGLNPDPRVQRALEMAEAAATSGDASQPPQSLTVAMSRIQALRLASLKAAYTDETTPMKPDATEAARAAAAAAACAAARCIDDAAADAAFAVRSAIAALHAAKKPVKPFWQAARRDYQALLKAGLGPAGTIGKPVPPKLLADTPPM